MNELYTRRHKLGSMMTILAALFSTACLVDSDAACEPNQDLVEGTCVCIDDHVLADYGCEPCAEHETAAAGECVCELGFDRPSEDAPCEELPPGQGLSCDAETPCADPTFAHCQVAGAAESYCTNTGCETGDCTGGYGCNTTTDPSFCQRPPSGINENCATSADCEGYDAALCETLKTKTCQVGECTLDGDDCFPGYSCCDTTPFYDMTMCVPDGTCPF